MYIAKIENLGSCDVLGM